MKLELYGKTDVGRCRESNEDSFGILESSRLAVVCDGMGGHAAGEVASRTVVDTVLQIHSGMPVPHSARTAFNISLAPGDVANKLVASLRIANTRAYQMSVTDSALSGMGTTAVAAVFEDDAVCICHAGDSRAYRISSGTLSQLTVDHSLLSEMIASQQLSDEDVENFPNKNVITRALGVKPRISIDMRYHRIADGELYLLCSDGLTGMLTPRGLIDAIESSGPDLATIAGTLIDRANEAGGEDNITCVLARVTDVEVRDDEAEVAIQSLTVPEETDAEYDAQIILADVLGRDTHHADMNALTDKLEIVRDEPEEE